MSPLHEAILIDSVDEVSKLWQPSDDNDHNLLKLYPTHLAVFRPQHLKVLLDAGAMVNCGDWNGRTPLMYAAAIGSSGDAISLIKQVPALGREIIYMVTRIS
jgi:ankyrin repeat protein